MRRRYIPSRGCVRHVRSLSFTLLVGCQAVGAKSVGESPHALPQTAAAPMHAGAAGAAPGPRDEARASAPISMVQRPASAPTTMSAAPVNTPTSMVQARVSTPSMVTHGAAGAPAAAPRAEDYTPGKVELRCADGAPAQPPAGYALVAADVANPWTVDDGTLSWLDTSDRERWTLWRKPNAADAVSTPASGVTSGPNLISNADTIAADGGDLFMRASQLVGQEPRVVLRQVPGQTLADEAGTGLGALVVDQDAVYWLAAEDERISVYRTSRTAAETRALGSVPFGWARGAQTRAVVAGLVGMGDSLYVALSSSGRAQVFRAAKGGNEPLAPLGDELAAVAGLTTDGTDLLLVLDPELDDLGNVRESARIVRMTNAGELHEITAISYVGPSYSEMNVAVSGGRVYWIENQQGSWLGTLWSAPLDGSHAPIKELTTPENLLSSGPMTEDGAVYFAVYCRVDNGSEVSGRTHLIRFQP